MVKNTFNQALQVTLPVIIVYLVLGIAYAVLFGQKVHPHWAWPLLMSLFVYAGSSQF